MWHSGRKSQRRQSAILPASIRSFFFLASAIARSITGCATFTCAAREEVIVDPAGENSCLHRCRPRLRQCFDPPIQFIARGTDSSFAVDLSARVLHAVADGLLVNIQANVVHKSIEEPPWLSSE